MVNTLYNNLQHPTRRDVVKKGGHWFYGGEWKRELGCIIYAHKYTPSPSRSHSSCKNHHILSLSCRVVILFQDTYVGPDIRMAQSTRLVHLIAWYMNRSTPLYKKSH